MLKLFDWKISKKRIWSVKYKNVDVEQEKTGQLRGVKDCLSEINELQQKLQVSGTEITGIKV